MLRTLRHYYQIYLGYISNNAAQAMSFRINFLLLFLVDLAFQGSAFGSVSFIFDHVDTIGPWNRDQFLFFIAFTMAIDQLHMTFFMMNFWFLSTDLKQGNLDFHLLKPVGVLFPIFFRHIRFGSMLILPLPWAVMVYYGCKLGLGLLDWMMLPILVLLSLALLLAIEFLLSATMFWTIDGVGINFIRMQLQSVSRWPNFIYGFFFRKIFTIFIPVLLVSSAPVHFLLRTSHFEILVYLVVALIFFCYFNKLFWRVALRKYESASS